MRTGEGGPRTRLAPSHLEHEGPPQHPRNPPSPLLLPRSARQLTVHGRQLPSPIASPPSPRSIVAPHLGDLPIQKKHALERKDTGSMPNHPPYIPPPPLASIGREAGGQRKWVGRRREVRGGIRARAIVFSPALARAHAAHVADPHRALEFQRKQDTGSADHALSPFGPGEVW